MNKLIISGNIGRAELSYTQKGTAHLKLNVGVTRKYKSDAGEWIEDTDWFYVDIWEKRAEALAKFLKVGQRVLIDGEMRSYQYDREGVKTTGWNVRCIELEVLTKKGEEGDIPSGNDGYGAPPPYKADTTDAPADDDIPF